MTVPSVGRVSPSSDFKSFPDPRSISEEVIKDYLTTLEAAGYSKEAAALKYASDEVDRLRTLLKTELAAAIPSQSGKWATVSYEQIEEWNLRAEEAEDRKDETQNELDKVAAALKEIEATLYSSPTDQNLHQKISKIFSEYEINPKALLEKTLNEASHYAWGAGATTAWETPDTIQYGDLLENNPYPLPEP